MTVTVKWGRERISFDLPAPDTPLASIRKSLADYTHLPLDAFKLIHAGAVMKDDSAPISAYGLRPNSTIALIGATDPHTRVTAAQSQSENSIIATIQTELHAVRTSLLPDLDTFLHDPTNDKEHRRIGELLLQSLIRLDAIVAEPAWEAARKERKDAVREVQDMLDRLDGARSSPIAT
ncbi:BAG family molecular chaperone regulator 1A [Hypsizygus marmoreus]|uniref:BAG family molecular chaperone regulator 1A n=1 Tax=Hypsizygus marmoreus TaxID=39966 RepID=A0A369JX01_HYPMA|nr:BAG family molecular chaperone regulator 1A [Hypsizygus marmoreus]